MPVNLVMQTPERPGPRDSRIDFRRGFHGYVMKHFPEARVVLVEFHESRAEELQRLWADHPNVLIEHAVWCEDQQCTGQHRIYAVTAPDGSIVQSEDRFFAQRFNPSADPRRIPVPCRSTRVLTQEASIGLMSIDAGVPSQVEMMQDRNINADRISVTIQDAAPNQVLQLEQSLNARGYLKSGRAWGAANSSILLSSPSTLPERVQSHLGDVRTRLGSGLVDIRDRAPLGDRRTALMRRIANSGVLSKSRTANIDPSYGLPLSPVSRASVEEVIAKAQSPERDFEIVMRESELDDVARECFEELGMYPISFSHPDVYPVREPTVQLSPIIPGFPYTFENNMAYMNHYSQCNLAITHRKAGWDCFRHVEIGASGSIPLMPDVAEIPKYAMVHYPKKALEVIRAEVMSGGSPGPATRMLLRAHFVKHQTTRAMADYVLRMSGAAEVSRVLFIDEQLPKQADYLSVLTLIGLKQIFAEWCDVLFPVPYIYDDYVGDTHALYGRGFGYSGALSADLKSEGESTDQVGRSLKFDSYDLVVVGSLYRNMNTVDELDHRTSNAITVGLYGEDTPPTTQVLYKLKQSGMTIFMRPIHI